VVVTFIAVKFIGGVGAAAAVFTLLVWCVHVRHARRVQWWLYWIPEESDSCNYVWASACYSEWLLFIGFSILVHGRSLSIANAYISTFMWCRYSIQYSHLTIISYYLINCLHFSLKLFDLKHMSLARTSVITYFTLSLRKIVLLELMNFLTRFLSNNASFRVFEVGFGNWGLATA